MYRHRNVVAKHMVVQNVNGEKQKNIDQPASDWYSIWLEKERRSILVELRNITGDGYEEELDKSQKSSLV